MTIPKAFISYSHDSQEHKAWVLDLATLLRNRGIDAIIDQWELKPGDDLPHFMETHLASSDYVVMVCTDQYVTKANSGSGGVGYEKMIVTADLLKNIDSNKVIPIIKQCGTHNVPTFLKTKLFIDFSLSEGFDFALDELSRAILDAPLIQKPEIGHNPFTPIADIRPNKTSDILLELMTLVVADFDRGDDNSLYTSIVQKMSVSRIFLDKIIEEAVVEGLIHYNSAYGLIQLREKGKAYAIEHNIVQA